MHSCLVARFGKGQLGDRCNFCFREVRGVRPEGKQELAIHGDFEGNFLLVQFSLSS